MFFSKYNALVFSTPSVTVFLFLSIVFLFLPFPIDKPKAKFLDDMEEQVKIISPIPERPKVVCCFPPKAN